MAIRRKWMLERKIETLREKLDNLILNNAPYDEIYRASLELDKYIAEYYRIVEGERRDEN